jgi:hypothetical protein
LLLAGLLLQAAVATAQGRSLIFIQGDKELPFYVTVDGEMAPRYYKNHVLIPKLYKGAYDLQILFEQNKHAPVNFRVEVGDSSNRPFYLCTYKGEYALYDLDNKVYLTATEH